MGDWYVNKDFGNMQTTSEFSAVNVPVFQNRTGHPVKLDTARIAGVVTASASNYYVIALKDSAGNTIVSKDMASVGLTASGSTSMGTVDTDYQIIDSDETIYVNFAIAGTGAGINWLTMRLDGETLRGG